MPIIATISFFILGIIFLFSQFKLKNEPEWTMVWGLYIINILTLIIYWSEQV